MIYINGKFLLQRRTGVQRYAFELTELLLKSELSVRILVPKSADLSGLAFPESSFIKMGFFSNLTAWEQIDLMVFVAKEKSSLLVSFCNTGPAFLRNHIICIHDMSYHFNPNWFSKSFASYYKILIPILAKNALHIVTVSEFSKKEICSVLNLSSKKISVISNAPSRKFVATDVDSLIFEKENFFLFVGSHDPRKNIQLLIRLFGLKEYNSLQLIIVGAASGSFQNETYSPNDNIKFITDYDDALLASNYKRARALINSSFYEGFGLPVVKAMASGCPLIISYILAFDEVAKKKAAYFDPHSLSTLKIAVNNFLKKTDDELKLLNTQNYHFSFNYDWNLACNQFIRLINQLNNERS